MATILPFPMEKVVPVWGLMEHECDAVHAEAHGMMLEGRVTGLSTQNDTMYLCVFDGQGEPYYIGREEGICYLFGADETLLAHSRHFVIVLQALKMLLTSPPDIPA